MQQNQEEVTEGGNEAASIIILLGGKLERAEFSRPVGWIRPQLAAK